MSQQQNLAAQESNERSGKDEQTITETEVTTPKARLDFLFSKLRSQCVDFENAVYLWMGKLCPEYSGGFWKFYNLSNGSFYMQPPKSYELCSPNGFMDEVTAQEAGIIVTIMMFSELSFATHRKGLTEDCERISNYYHQLREYIFTLDENTQSKIFSAID